MKLSLVFIFILFVQLLSAQTFTEAPSYNPFEGAEFSSIAFTDVDGDQDQDVLITGLSRFTLISKLYTNNGTGDFAEVLGTPFEGVIASSIAFADVDGDQDQDVLITGRSNDGKISKLYINEGQVSSIGHISEDLPFEFILYPNPSATDKIHVSFTSEENGLLTVNVFDMNGRLVKQQQEILGVGQQTFSMDITSLNKGSYIIQLDDGKRKGVHKILVQ